MRIGLIAQKTGVSRDTIRLYEKMELLTGVTRPYEYNNYKEYPESNIQRIKLIITMKKLGLSLKECKKVIDTIEDDNYSKKFQNEFINKKLEEIDFKIQELLGLKNLLNQYIDTGCDNEEIIEKIK